jgi:dienelactone hydrolase
VTGRVTARTGQARYRAVNDEVFDLYAQEEFARALSVVVDARAGLGRWDAELALLAACLLGRLGRPEESLAELREAAGRGGWWDPRVLAEDDDLVDLRDDVRFQELVHTVGDRWREANAELDRSGDVLVPGNSPRALLVALHGAEEDAADAAEVWGPVATGGRMALLAVRSSQRTSPAYRTWPDPDRALREVVDAWRRLPDRLRDLPVVVAGFSAGGRVALRVALAPTPLPASAVLAVAPAVTPSDLEDVPLEARSSGAVWIGADDALRQQVELLAPRLAAAGLTVTEVEGLGHAVPADLAGLALAALHDR